jgi:hypothetical protein
MELQEGYEIAPFTLLTTRSMFGGKPADREEKTQVELAFSASFPLVHALQIPSLQTV